MCRLFFVILGHESLYATSYRRNIAIADRSDFILHCINADIANYISVLFSLGVLFGSQG